MTTEKIAFEDIKVGDTLRTTEHRVNEAGTKTMEVTEGVVDHVNQHGATDLASGVLAWPGASEDVLLIERIARTPLPEPAPGSVVWVGVPGTVGNVYHRGNYGWRRTDSLYKFAWKDIVAGVPFPSKFVVEVLRDGV